MADNKGETLYRASVTEIVGRFAKRESFKSAVEALLAAGFERTDLSVLDSHDTLAAADGRAEGWRRTLAGLVGEVKYLEPITAAGLILLASGTIGAAIAGVIAAGLGSMALYELLGEVRATPHTREFAQALEKGDVLLWVRAETPERRTRATEIYAKFGAADVHTHIRETRAGPTR
ncbi:MAG TPA: hypothetical protein VEJ16_00220 [Alphaproteobacteria bacterium]|nr:hypothetical protein [Alphaproteobacteria bacterium]